MGLDFLFLKTGSPKCLGYLPAIQRLTPIQIVLDKVVKCRTLKNVENCALGVILFFVLDPPCGFPLIENAGVSVFSEVTADGSQSEAKDKDE